MITTTELLNHKVFIIKLKCNSIFCYQEVLNNQKDPIMDKRPYIKTPPHITYIQTNFITITECSFYNGSLI